MKVIELQGVNFINKGAHLMLDAVVEHVNTTFPDLKLGLSFRTASFAQRNENGLAHIMYVRGKRSPAINRAIDLGCSIVPSGLRDRFAIARESDVTAVLDASGFLYSDQWGAAKIHRMSKRVEGLRAKGVPVVFLPQAFGPFKDADTKVAIKRLVDASTLIFARDNVSMRHMTEAAGTPPQLRQAPDFTNLVSAEGKPAADFPANALLIVPNSRMLDKTDASAANQYLPLLMDVIREGRAKGFEPAVLVHDSNEDLLLGQRIQAELGQPVKLIEVDDPRHLKAYLAAASAVVGSRFHALVGALASGTPSIAIGWSHKYDELMNDYGSPELSLRATERDKLMGILTQWSDKPTLAAHAEAVAKKAKELKQESGKMWSAVDEVLASVR